MPRSANFVPRYCTVETCSRIHYGRGWCKTHYGQWRLTGNPIPRIKKVAKPNETIEWLRSHVDHKGAECLPWPFARNRAGYGHLEHELTGSASRLMCILAHGNPKDSTLQTAHNCGKGHEGCVNPQHLRWATRVENSADKIKHGTTNRGERHPLSKLTEDDIRLIRTLAGSTSREQIAKMFNVGRQAIDRVVTGERWGWYTGNNSTVKDAMSKSRAAEYSWWRRRVLTKDNYTCRKCGVQSRENLNVHHIHPFALNSDLRLDVGNGTTLCAPCHLDYHRTYGVTNANAETFAQFLLPFAEAA